MRPENSHREALWQLLQQTRLTGHEVNERLGQALDRRYWEELNPSLTIGREELVGNIEVSSLSAEEQLQVVEQFYSEGFFQLNSLLSHPVTSRLRRAVEVVKHAGWPPVFGFVYDQFWVALRPPSLMKLITAILGPGFRQSWHLWSHYVQPKRGASGWPAHVDNYRYPGRVTIWIPLSDATLDNGCLYLIPRDLISDQILETLYGSGEMVATRDLQVMLQSAEALPAAEGSVLGWQHEVIHWGSCHRGKQGEPRISITSEFISATAAPRDDEMTPLDLSDSLPDFGRRLNAIASEILLYEKTETLLIRHSDFARELLAATRADATAALAKQELNTSGLVVP